MSAFLSSVPKLQFFDANGDPLAGGKLYTYAAGTTTPLATYTDSTGATPNTNPIILDSRGEANVWLTAVAYKFELKTSADALIWTVDNISNALNLSQLLANSGSAANPPYTFAADPTTGMYLGAVGQIALSANGTPVLRSSDTSMTIGQAGGSNDVDTTVYGDFSVNGLLEVTSSSDPSQAFYRPTNAPGAGVGRVTWEGQNSSNARASYARIQGEITANTAGAHTGNLNFYTATAGALTEKMRIDSSGNVGVGTSSPAHTLDVNVASASFRVRNASGGNDFTVKSVAGPITQIGSVANTPLQILTNDLARIHVAAAGNVGIGTTDPANKFVVSNGGGAGLEITPNGLASNPILVSYNRATSAYGQLSFGSDFLVFCTNGTTEQARITSAGLLQFNSGYGSVATAYGCRAWVNFNGTGTPARRGNGNVDSITDNGTGDYTVNFTTSMPDTNYAAVATAKVEDNDTIGTNNNTTIAGTAVRAVGSVKVLTSSTSSVKVDCAIVNVAIFR